MSYMNLAYIAGMSHMRCDDMHSRAWRDSSGVNELRTSRGGIYDRFDAFVAAYTGKSNC